MDKDEEIAALRSRLDALETPDAPPPSPPPKKSGLGCFTTGALVVAAIIVVVSLMPKPEQTEAEKEAEAQASEDSRMIAGAQIALENMLRDPKSVRYGAVVVSRKTGLPIVCGYYNAKNGFGGYSGDEPFMSTKDQLMLPTSLGKTAFVKLWNESC